MPDVFWIGAVLAGVIFLIGVFAGARSPSTGIATGAAIGAFMGVMLAFPLLALGLAGS
jgi:urea transporter